MKPDLVFPVSFSVSSRLFFPVSEGEFVVTLFESVRIWLITVVFVRCGRGQMAALSLGVGLHQFL